LNSPSISLSFGFSVFKEQPSCPRDKSKIRISAFILLVVIGGASWPSIAGNGQLVAGGQINTFALSTVIKINKVLQTSMTHSPARLPQAIVGGW